MKGIRMWPECMGGADKRLGRCIGAQRHRRLGARTGLERAASLDAPKQCKTFSKYGEGATRITAQQLVHQRGRLRRTRSSMQYIQALGGRQHVRRGRIAVALYKLDLHGVGRHAQYGYVDSEVRKHVRLGHGQLRVFHGAPETQQLHVQPRVRCIEAPCD